MKRNRSSLLKWAASGLTRVTSSALVAGLTLWGAAAGCTKPIRDTHSQGSSSPSSAVAAPAGDPEAGQFSLAKATAGLEGSGPLTAVLDTTLGTVTCELRDKEAPSTVANFVGLARGKRPFLDPQTQKWVTRPFYNGLTFHRVIPGFMIQGGDLLGNGTGQPGYTIKSEANNGLIFDKPGRLAMARRADPDSAGAQFFISDGTPSHLNGAYTIFGDCSPTEVVTKIANVAKDERDRPRETVTIRSVVIKRR